MSRRRIKRIAPLLALALGACTATEQISSPESTTVGVPEANAFGLESRVAALLRDGREAVLAAPDSAEAWGRLGESYDVHGFYEEAADCYRRARELDPSDFRWPYFLAIVRDLRGAPAHELAALYAEAAALRPDYAPTQVRLGIAFSKRGMYREARAAFEQALALDSRSAGALRGLALTELATGEVRAARDHLLAAARLNPNDGTIHAALAQSYMRLGDRDAAVRAADLAERLDPEPALSDALRDRELEPLGVSSTFCFARAKRLLKRGEYRRAIEDLDVVLEAQPQDHVAHLWMGSALVKLGQPERALPYMQRTLELRDDLAPVHFTVGALLEHQGRTEEALSHYRRALDLEPDHARARKALAAAEAKQAAARDRVAGL